MGKKQDAALKATLSNPDITFEELATTIQEQVSKDNVGFANGYGLSKAACNALTLVQAKAYPNLKVVCLSPGYVRTPMTGNSGGITPEQGCVSSLVCLFGRVTNGHY